ncbi:SurA N-terminal domain-containing protein [Methyloceanibacter sp. wino2]|uniref:SurA N-terminal domain-containing protein n=1 Tax=Methyloceanibacter sp. wino2 TaxID=2170729 RepID=UPI000D3EA5C1|nr:SurA N-terminal domain-containing protein [Methyloceanibacter sp. wino2]
MALATLRKGAARTFGLILVALLVVSFAIWGIADIFTGYGQQTLIEVGDTEISPQDYQRAQQDVLRTMSQDAGRALSLQEARAAGLDQRVLERLVGGAAVDTHASHLGLSISDEALLEQIMKDPSFQDGAGNFSPLAFQSALRNIGMSEGAYLQTLREQTLRRQLLVTVGEVASSPKAVIDALNRFNEERRILKYVLVPKSAAEAPGDPTEQDLKAYYDNHKQTFTQPEYRKVGLIAVTPDTVRDELNITEADIKATYESKKDTLGQAETRHVQQIALPSTEEAEKVAAKIEAGTDFVEAAKELGLSESDIDLGTVAKKDLADSVVAEEAFKLEKDEVSKPVTGKLGGVVLLRVTEITEGKIPTFEEAKANIEKDLVKERASGAIFDMHDKVEDELASGATLEETAGKLKLDYVVVDQVDRTGAKPDGTQLEAPAQKELLNGVFATDAGIENDPIDARDEGVVWYEVLGITPETLQPFDDVRSEVEEGWRGEATRNQVKTYTDKLISELNSGSKTLDGVASDLGQEVLPTSALKRDDITVNVLPPAVQQAFSLPKGGYGSAASGVDEGRIVFQVEDIVEPPEVDPRALKQLGARIGLLYSEDIIAEYFSELEQTYGVKVNRQALARLTGTGEAP